MMLKYYGTGSCDGIPSIFCDCENCRRIRTVGGKSIRTRHQSSVDDKILIDFPADTAAHVLYGGLPLYNIHSILLTHAHEDHLYIDDFLNRDVQSQCMPDGAKTLTVYSSAKTGASVREFVGKCGNKHMINFQELLPFESRMIEGYEVTPLKAAHAYELDSYIYIISRGNKSILYAHDTGYFPEETWDYITTCGKKFGVVSLDSSYLTAPSCETHMGLEDNVRVRNRLLQNGNADVNTRFIINHLSHFHKFTHEELCEYIKPMGLIAAYDGMIVEL
ncbi:MAG: MBL fold metallo-hydrolase [Clostridiales bacterium]|nr:MBL fold metallo-hydrolase [Clostridiales bacterium]